MDKIQNEDIAYINIRAANNSALLLIQAKINL